MNKNVATFLSEALQWDGIEHDVRDDYSGRGMYGDTTCGIVLDNPLELIGASIRYILETQIELEEIPDDFSETTNLQTDNMGLRHIVY